MGYQFWVQNEAKAEIKQLPGHVRQRVRWALQDLSHDRVLTTAAG